MNVEHQTAEPMSFAALRRLRGYTQTQLAKAAGWANASSISRIERGQHPPLNRAERLAEALGVTLETLSASIDRSRSQPTDEPAEESEAPGPD
jgi:transcriptional regulator with XRE-family HTH domain